MTGFPAARRCHSCVQVKDGKDYLTQHLLDTTFWSAFTLTVSLSFHLQRCLYVGVITESWSSPTCGKSTCRHFSGPSCLQWCLNRPIFTVLQSLRLVNCLHLMWSADFSSALGEIEIYIIFFKTYSVQVWQLINREYLGVQNSLSGSCFSSNLCLYPLGRLHVCAR